MRYFTSKPFFFNYNYKLIILTINKNENLHDLEKIVERKLKIQEDLSLYCRRN